jgi:hypothetical protein
LPFTPQAFTPQDRRGDRLGSRRRARQLVGRQDFFGSGAAIRIDELDEIGGRIGLSEYVNYRPGVPAAKAGSRLVVADEHDFELVEGRRNPLSGFTAGEDRRL